MPRGNGTGPNGMGRMTGRGAGSCAGYGVPGAMNPGTGLFFGRGCGIFCRGGGGRGWRNMYFATGQPVWMRGSGANPETPYFQKSDPETEKQALKNRADFLKSQLELLEKK